MSFYSFHRFTGKSLRLEQFRFVFLLFSRFAGKPEALKVFQCASTVKAVMENSAMLAGDAFADILEAVWRFFTSLRSVQNDNCLACSVQNDTGETRFFYPGRGGGVKAFVKAGWHGTQKTLRGSVLLPCQERDKLLQRRNR